MRNLDHLAKLARTVRSLLLRDDVIDIGQIRQWDHVLGTVALVQEARSAGVDIPDSEIDRIFGLNDA